jgi:hypothetical protein
MDAKRRSNKCCNQINMIIATFKKFLEQEVIHTFQKVLGARSDSSVQKVKAARVLFGMYS